MAPGGTAAGWTVLIGCWALVAVTALFWAAARLAASVTTGTVEPFGMEFAADLVHGRASRAWPHTPALAVTFAAVVLLGLAACLVVVLAGVIVRHRAVPGDPVAALARNPRMLAMTRLPAARTAIGLRRSLAGADPRHLDPAETGLALGQLIGPGQRVREPESPAVSAGSPAAGRHRQAGRPVVYASWEDTVVAFMAPRSGKTTALAIPFVLSAPGAVIATSNKADLWAATAALRAAATGGTVWLFDPQHVTWQPQAWWWNLLHGLATVEDAHRLAGHFVLTVADEHRRDLWGPAAQDLLAALFLAAASSGRSLHDVAGWLNEPAVPTPIELLADAGFTAMAASLRGAQNGAPETRDGIYQTARTAAKAMTDPEIMAWVTPPAAGLPMFDPEAFAASRDTLYLLSKSRSAAAPLIAALSDTAMRAAERRAERLGGRLDPPLVVPLDEAANICRIADLPDLYSHLGSRGITPVTILQSYEQGVTVWGEHGMATLWGAATKKIIGAGVDSPRLARDLATLVGQHDVPVRTLSYGDGRVSESVSLRRQDILEPAAIRALPPGTALLLATGIKAALIHLTPWYAGPRAAEITTALSAAHEQIRDRAIQAGPATPHLPATHP
jgi:type IV secretory pathway TraG/TraD family ATPase VirD4